MKISVNSTEDYLKKKNKINDKVKKKETELKELIKLRMEIDSAFERWIRS